MAQATFQVSAAIYGYSLLIWTVQERIFLSSQKVLLDSAAMDEKSVTVNILLACAYQALTACQHVYTFLRSSKPKANIQTSFGC